jgi:hypothetical protein
MSLSPTERRRTNKIKALEGNFSIPSSILAVHRTEYNALFDPNMRYFFENRNVQSLLFSSGQIDQYGRVIDLERQKSKLKILEREFRAAQMTEEKRQQDEMDMRYRVQKKRFEELEYARKEEAIHRTKLQKEIGRDIISMSIGRSSPSRTGSIGSSVFKESHYSQRGSPIRSPGGTTKFGNSG